MNQIIDSKNTDEVSLKGLFRIVWRGKWWFAGTFILIIIAGLLITFLQIPEYRSESEITISSEYIYYNNEIYNYFPDEAGKLWITRIFTGSNETDFENRALEEVSKEIKSTIFLEKLAEKTGISAKDLSGIVFISRESGTVKITTITSNAETAYNINKNLIALYRESKSTDLGSAYNELVNKINTSLKVIDEEVKALSQEAAKYVTDFNINFLKEAQKSGIDNTFSEGINFLDPLLESKINTKYKDYELLDEVKNNLTNNKDFFTNRLNIVKEPELSFVKENVNLKRNLFISIFAAIIIGLIIPFIVNFAKSKK